ncbi:hypothetical protein EK904_007714 [Melospiza melodia maxima]|nr:hypothetical protein EK904_007714 [Melospiza melodia maxima]
MSYVGNTFITVVLISLGKKRRRRLDRNMIGEPMNFVHTAHVGAGEMSSDYSSAVSIQDHMKSKGGYTNGTSATVEI